MDMFTCSLVLSWVLLLSPAVVEPRFENGSSQDYAVLTADDDVAAPRVGGICASAVAIYGYKCLEIEVTTEDGYILNIQRIPEGRGGGGGGEITKRPPVLFQHGILVDGLTWFLNLPEQNLPMILADQGFDVWIGNTRGTRYSRRHTSLDPNEKEFWNWSWDELVEYDLPAFFDYVYNHTQQTVHYVGHSLGTLIALASFSEGKLKGKIKSAALLSPIAYLSHMTTPLGLIAARAFLGEILYFHHAEFNPKGIAAANFLKALCASNLHINCYDLITSITGQNCCLNSSSIKVFIANEPQSTATKNLVHLSQIVRDNVIAKFDYGWPDLNMFHYGTFRPPVYDIANIPKDTPLFVSYGGKDALSDVVDVMHLLDLLKLHDVDKLSVQFVKEYAHADFIMAVNAKDIVFNQVVSFFKKHV